MAYKQLTVIFGVLSFLGIVALLVVGCVVILAAWAIGNDRLSRGTSAASNWLFGGRGLAGKAAICVSALVCGYFAVLIGASLFSHEWTLSPGAEKYFCEIDCHLAYSVTGGVTTKTLGGSQLPVSADGLFYVVTVRTRFDETTISKSRPLDLPLTPSPRALTIVDDQGREFSVSAAGQQALARSLGTGTPLTQPLRPGESYLSQFVFDLPRDARNPRLLIRTQDQPAWIDRIVIGDENSLLHKKVFLRLPG